MPEIKNLKKAAERILEAIGKRENILLYGDGDLDGVSSVIILKETIRSLGGKVSAVYFPDREIEGYGITEVGLKFLKKNAPALLIVVDCGIGNFKEVKLAKKLGFEVIIIEHHEVLDKLPGAEIVVNPKQKGDKYPFKGLATVGIAFKLSELILGDKIKGVLKNTFLELVALATLADMMPQQSENKLFISEGLSLLKRTFRPGIKVFFETEIFKNSLDFIQKVSKMISILNVRDVAYRFPASYRLLTVSSPKEAKKIVKVLLKKSKIRKEKIERIIEEVEKRIKGIPGAIIFEGDSDFELILMSSAASVICQKYQRPTFLYKKMEKESQGTVRTPKDTDAVDLMKKCKKYPLTYGGHPRAAGFRVKNGNLEKFKKCLSENI